MLISLRYKFSYIVLISFSYIILLFVINRAIIETSLLAAIFSCDRSDFLNTSLYSFFYHVKNYEKRILVNFHFIDSGTNNRNYFVKYYKIENSFFMNPNDPEFSYRLFWSYLHSEFVLFLEDDRPFINNIEKHIIYPNYLEEAILILKRTNIVKGIILKRDGIGRVRKKRIKTKLL